MTDYISREAAIEKSFFAGLYDQNEVLYGSAEVVLADEIRAIPAADVRPVRMGKWKLGVCQECLFDWGAVAPIANVPNFCPNCGDDMRGEGL